MPSPAETLARRAARALSPSDFQDAAEVLEREARREQQRTHPLVASDHAPRADALRRIADLIRSIGDE